MGPTRITPITPDSGVIVPSHRTITPALLTILHNGQQRTFPEGMFVLSQQCDVLRTVYNVWYVGRADEKGYPVGLRGGIFPCVRSTYVLYVIWHADFLISGMIGNVLIKF